MLTDFFHGGSNSVLLDLLPTRTKASLASFRSISNASPSMYVLYMTMYVPREGTYIVAPLYP